MSRTEQIVRLSEFLDRHRGSLLSLPGVAEVGVGPRRLNVEDDVVVQIFVRSPDVAADVRARAGSMLDASDVEVFVLGNLEPERG